MTENADQAPAVRLAMFTIDCAEPAPLAAFYSALLGLEITYQDENAAMIGGKNGPAIGVGRVDHYTPPQWPDENSDKQFHLDFDVPDIEAASRRAVELGATLPTHQPGETWRVLLDPAGHPFCLASWS